MAQLSSIIYCDIEVTNKYNKIFDLLTQLTIYLTPFIVHTERAIFLRLNMESISKDQYFILSRKMGIAATCIKNKLKNKKLK